ncbi:glycosyltransferase family 4 protein [Candidatus Uhrbacteria bacterium]|nr:glycosyltransferase family 4 protein [Candidatus Uhrbacteria bacterium]
MRIAIDVRHLTHPNLSGVGQYTLHLVRALSRLAPDDRFVLFASGTAPTLARLPALAAPNIEVVTKAIPNRALFALLKTPGGPALESFLPGRVDAWLFPDGNIIRTRLPYALTVHDLSYDIFPQFFTAKDRLRNRVAGLRRLAEGADTLLAVSRSTALDLTHRWGIADDRIVVTPLGVGPQFVPSRAPSDTNYQRGYGLNAPYLLSLATLEPRKNIESVIEAYGAFRQATGHKVRLAIGGGKGWKYKEIFAAAAASPFAHDIIFLGYVHEKHKPALYRGARAFLFPSFYEGFGLPVLEAMASGTPVVTSATSSLPELTGDAAVLVDPMNVTDVAVALEELLASPGADALRAMLVRRGLTRARQFHWDRTASLTLDALRALTA